MNKHCGNCLYYDKKTYQCKNESCHHYKKYRSQLSYCIAWDGDETKYSTYSAIQHFVDGKHNDYPYIAAICEWFGINPEMLKIELKNFLEEE